MGRDEYLKSQGLIDNKLALSNSRSENKSFIPVVNNGSGGGFNEMKEKSSLMDLRSQIINLAIDIEAKAQSKSDQREEDILLNGAKLGLGDLEKNNPVPFVGREEEKLENLGVSSQNKLLPNNGVINVPTTNTTNIDKKKEDEVVVRPVISFDGPLSNNNKRVSTPPLKVETKKAEINLADILNVPITRKESDKKGSEPNKAKEESFLDTLFGGRPVKPVYSPNVVSPSPAKIVQNKKEQITDEDSDDDFFT
uniref:Uncharacterized protein n=1 Tax=Rhabditophanes sp. KR3021 TaxID=114890 RepID=A0AC35TSH2_9BILA